MFSRFLKSTTLRETRLFDVMIVKIGAGVLAVSGPKNQKTRRVTRGAVSPIWGVRNGGFVS